MGTANTRKRRTRKTPLSQEIRKIYRSLVIVAICLTLGLGALLLYTGGLQTTKGYELRKLQIKNAELEQENKHLETKIIQSRTTGSIEESNKLETMENVLEKEHAGKGKVIYFQGGGNIARAE